MTRLIVKRVCEQNSRFLITNAVNIYVTKSFGHIKAKRLRENESEPFGLQSRRLCLYFSWKSVCMCGGGEFTVFLNCLHTFSESMPHILRTLHTNPKKKPQFSCKMKLYIPNNVISSQNGILFSNDTHKPSYV